MLSFKFLAKKYWNRCAVLHTNNLFFIKRAPEKYLWSSSILVPRDRIELPTRGFSVLIVVNSE
jgi:hypothetical protein